MVTQLRRQRAPAPPDFSGVVEFCLQHLFVAVSWVAIPGYLFAFVTWGLGAAPIRRRQGRLWPLVVAHLVTNSIFSLVPVLFMLLG
ncbi:MAG: hypothetical protein WAV45_15875 [Propionibacteriaceae bacterium]|nr:hypothetical protein [Micropruina sp.]HBX81945.1 hypothetical protein [Propionibacteriaceae bacterium]HBY22753.1 hypothetical protein [Propionibacteriaceae bacterium]